MGVFTWARARVRGVERGAAVVEFALVVPLLLSLVFGIISFGYMLSFRQALSQGAAEGARAAAVAPPLVSAGDKTLRALHAVNEALQSYGVTCVGTQLLREGQVVGSCDPTVAACVNDAARQCVSVRLTYDYRDHPLLPSVPGLGFSLPESLSYTAVAEVSV